MHAMLSEEVFANNIAVRSKQHGKVIACHCLNQIATSACPLAASTNMLHKQSRGLHGAAPFVCLAQ